MADVEQKQLAGFLDQLAEELDQIASSYDQKVAHLTHLKQSLLQKAFTGELTADRQAADRTLSEARV